MIVNSESRIIHNKTFIYSSTQDRLSNLDNCSVYFLVSSTDLVITNCTNCTFYTGLVKRTLLLERLDYCIINGCASNLNIKDISNSIININYSKTAKLNSINNVFDKCKLKHILLSEQCIKAGLDRLIPDSADFIILDSNDIDTTPLLKELSMYEGFDVELELEFKRWLDKTGCIKEIKGIVDCLK